MYDFQNDAKFNAEIELWKNKVLELARQKVSAISTVAAKKMSSKTMKKEGIVYRVRLTFSPLAAYINAGAGRGFAGENPNRKYEYKPTARSRKKGKKPEARTVNEWRAFSKIEKVKNVSSIGKAGTGKRKAQNWLNDAVNELKPELEQIIEKFFANQTEKNVNNIGIKIFDIVI